MKLTSSKKFTILCAALACAGSLLSAGVSSAALVYAVDLRGDRFVTFDTATPGNQTVLATGFAANYYGVDFDPTGTTLWALEATNLTVNSLNPLNGGVLTSVALTGLVTGDSITGLSIAPNGTFYVTASSGTTSRLYTLNPVTGTLSTIGNMGVALAIDIAINAAGQAYTIDIATDQLFSLDLTTGVATAIGAIGSNANFAQGMDFDSATGVLYAAIYIGSGVVNFSTINLATGAATTIPGITSGEYEITIRNAIPEPATVAMIALGGLVLAGRALHRRRQ